MMSIGISHSKTSKSYRSLPWVAIAALVLSVLGLTTMPNVPNMAVHAIETKAKVVTKKTVTGVSERDPLVSLITLITLNIVTTICILFNHWATHPWATTFETIYYLSAWCTSVPTLCSFRLRAGSLRIPTRRMAAMLLLARVPTQTKTIWTSRKTTKKSTKKKKFR